MVLLVFGGYAILYYTILYYGWLCCIRSEERSLELTVVMYSTKHIRLLEQTQVSATLRERGNAVQYHIDISTDWSWPLWFNLLIYCNVLCTDLFYVMLVALIYCIIVLFCWWIELILL